MVFIFFKILIIKPGAGISPAPYKKDNILIGRECQNSFGFRWQTKDMYPTRKFKRFAVIVCIILIGCANAKDLPTPDRIGAKERLRVISGQQAAKVVNRMHGQSVATNTNVIVEYGEGEKKDILYLSRYTDSRSAQEAFDLMIGKMAVAKKSPFSHLMPIGKYQKKVYMALGMGAVHYIYPFGNYLLWLQTFQSFGTDLPPELLALYPI